MKPASLLYGLLLLPVLASAAIDLEQVKKDNQFPTDQEIKKSLDKLKKDGLPDLYKIDPASGQKITNGMANVNLDKVSMPKQNVPDVKKLLEHYKAPNVDISGVDIAKLADQYGQLKVTLPDDSKDRIQEHKNGGAYLFISSSMPHATVENMLGQAGQLGVSVYLNGVIGDKPLSFKETQSYLQTFRLKKAPNILIHPPAFVMFNIKQVPALVVASEDVDQGLDESGCASPTDFSIIRGDVPVSYALQQVAEKSSNANVRAIANQKLAVLASK